MDVFERFYRTATQHDGTPFRGIWVHDDGRCLGMTGVGQHRLDAIPAGFIKDRTPLSEKVAIFVPSFR